MSLRSIITGTGHRPILGNPKFGSASAAAAAATPSGPDPSRKGSLLKAAFKVGMALVELRAAGKKR